MIISFRRWSDFDWSKVFSLIWIYFFLARYLSIMLCLSQKVWEGRFRIFAAYEAMVKLCWLSRVSVEKCNELACGHSFSKWFSTHLQDNLLYSKQHKSRLSTHVVFVCTRVEWITSLLKRNLSHQYSQQGVNEKISDIFYPFFQTMINYFMLSLHGEKIAIIVLSGFSLGLTEMLYYPKSNYIFENNYKVSNNLIWTSHINYLSKFKKYF